MINEKMLALGSKRSIIREIFEYCKSRAAQIGAENVYDFSIGNPSVAPPDEIGEAIFDLLGLEYAENQAGLFLWGRLPEGENCYDFCDRLLYDKGVFLTPGGIFGSEGNRYMRLSLCAPQNVLENVLNILK